MARQGGLGRGLASLFLRGMRILHSGLGQGDRHEGRRGADQLRAMRADEGNHFALVVTDPLILPPPGLAGRLRDLLARSSDAVAALPISNEAANAAQKRPPAAPYLTLRELQQVMAGMQKTPAASERVNWDKSDPGVYLCPTAFLDQIDDPPRRAIEGKPVVISGNDFIHRWSSLRGQAREDLLARIPADAKSILEFGCGEAPLGAALKARQKVRR